MVKKTKKTRNDNAAMQAVDKMRSDIIKATHEKMKERVVRKVEREKKIRELATLTAEGLGPID